MTEPAAGLHFDRHAPVYGRGRPPYPAEVFDRLAALGLFDGEKRILEIGAGSGQATVELVRRGARVDAVEPGPALAADLRRLAGVSVQEATAEGAVLPAATYDAVVGATSLHWVDVPAVLPMWHRALKPSGLLVAWWAVFGDPEVSTPFRDALDRLARDTGRHRPDDDRPRPLRVEERVAELTAGGLFDPVEAEVLSWPVRQTPAGLRDLFQTFPTWGDDPAVLDRVEQAAHDTAVPDGPFAGTVDEHYLCAFYVVRRAG